MPTSLSWATTATTEKVSVMISSSAADFESLTIDRVFEQGLHQFLNAFMQCNAGIAEAIADDYRFQR